VLSERYNSTWKIKETPTTTCQNASTSKAVLLTEGLPHFTPLPGTSVHCTGSYVLTGSNAGDSVFPTVCWKHTIFFLRDVCIRMVYTHTGHPRVIGRRKIGELFSGSYFSPAPSDSELLGSMATRLALVEQELLVAKREVIEKNQYIQHLEERVAVLEERGEGGGGSGSLRLKCLALQRQVEEMEVRGVPVWGGRGGDEGCSCVGRKDGGTCECGKERNGDEGCACVERKGCSWGVL